MTMRMLPVLTGAAVSLLSLGPAAADIFTCRVAADGKSVDAVITNPYKTETSCQVNCQMATTRPGTWFDVSCTKTVAPGGPAVLCSQTYGKGTLTKMVGGTGECIKPLKASDDADKDDDAEIEKLITDPDKLRDEVRKGLPPDAQKMLDQMKKP
jgi:hypothetical protein